MPCKHFYGYIDNTAVLASPNLLGGFLRALQTRTLKAIPLSKVFSQDDAASQSQHGNIGLVFGDNGELQATKKQRSCRIRSVTHFCSVLRTLMMSLSFVAVMVPGPRTDWSGDPERGIVKGERLQITRQGVEEYLAYWTQVGEEYGDRFLSALMRVELQMRTSWNNHFRHWKLLECCVIDSIAEFRGVVQSELASLKQAASHRQPGGLGGGGR